LLKKPGERFKPSPGKAFTWTAGSALKATAFFPAEAASNFAVGSDDCLTN
jgi:hypothetical protein